jgi:hypothetical protein
VQVVNLLVQLFFDVYFIMSLILMLGILCCVYLWAGEVFGTFILA